MDRKIQILSSLNGAIVGTGVQDISCDDGEIGPKGCTVLAGENERVDLIELDSHVAKLSAQELFRRCSMQTTAVGIRVEKEPKNKT